MSRGGKVEFDVPSMRHGASIAGQLGHAFEESAARVGGLPTPEGTPPEIAGELRAVSAALHHAAQSSAAQRQWLRFHAQLALLADGPMAALLALFSPPLVLPFDLPKIHLTKLKKPPKGPPGPDWLWHAGGTIIEVDKGEIYAAKSLVEGLARTGSAAAAAQYPGLAALQKALKDVPVLGKPYQWNQELKEGLKYARQHPGEFAKLVGQDAIAYNDYKQGRTGFAVGRNIVDFGSLLLPVTKLAAAGRAARIAEEANAAASASKATAASARAAAAEAERGLGKTLVRHPGESDAAYIARTKEARVQAGEAAGRAQKAADADKIAKQKLEDARVKAAQARHEANEIRDDLGHEYKHELKQSAIEKPNTSGQSVVGEHAEEERKESDEREHGHERPKR